MCGIVGAAGELNYQDEKVFTLMLQFDTIRGHHSTGVCKVMRQTNKVEVDKHEGTPWEFFDKSPMYGVRKGVIGCNKLLLGHNRWATVGAHTAENAHPFETENLVGVHNGTLEKSTFTKIDPKNEYEVDSEALFNLIDKKGLKKAIPECDGAWSLAYFDKKENKLNFLRNSKRPMCYAFKKDKSVVFFASEEWMIEAACEKVGVDILDINETKINHRYILDLNPTTYKSGVKFIYLTDPIRGTTTPRYKNVYTSSTNHGNSLGYTFGVNRTRKKEGTNHRLMQFHIQEMKDDDGYIDVYYTHLDYNAGIAKDYLVMRTCQHNYPVKLVQKSFDKKAEIRRSVGYKFKVKPNSYAWIEKDSTTDMYAVVAQYNSMSSPLVWDKETIETKEKEDNVIDFTTPTNFWDESFYIQGYNGQEIDDITFHQLISNGCSNCDKNWVETKDADLVHWINHQEFLCPDCATGF